MVRMRTPLTVLSAGLALAVSWTLTGSAASSASLAPQPFADPVAVEDDLLQVYRDDVRPILEGYCFACHGPDKQKGAIRFDEVDPDMVDGLDVDVWDYARDLLGSGEMPPKKAPQPTAEERRVLVDWLNASLLAAARANEGVHAPVLRRLNRAQYTNTLRELLGLGIEFGQVLPDDGKSHMGFTNNGEVLLTSPLHLEYYREIARDALSKAIVVGERPEPTHYRVEFGLDRGVGHPGARTGGYQSVPLDPDDFAVHVLDGQGRPKVGATEEEQAELDRVKRKVTVGFRGSSQDRFHTVEEGLILYGAVPHKEVAPGSWQGPSPNMKLEMQRVFPEEGDFVLRVEASRGYLVAERKELLIALDEPAPRATVTMHEAAAEPSEEQRLAATQTVLGPWYRGGPIFTDTGAIARDTEYTPRTGIDFDATLADGVTTWVEAGDVDGEVQRFETEIGAVLFARKIEAPSARTLELSLGSDDGLWVWLNGEPVLEADVRRGVSADQDRVSLDLVAGTNELLVKVVNFGGGFGSYTDVVHDGTRLGFTPYDVATEEAARVVLAERSAGVENLRAEAGGLVAMDFPSDSRARLSLETPPGYWQFDLVHKAMPVDAMGSIRFRVADMKLDLRPEATAEDLERGVMVTPIGAGYLNGGRHEFVLGGPFFVGFSHLIMTPLEDDHPLVERLEAQAAAEELGRTPALRAFIGTRTDDGMDYRTFDRPEPVDAPLGESQLFEFHGRLENLPIPEPESGDDEILSGICVLGVWNDHLVKSRRDTGPPLLIEALEFEAPYHPIWPPESHTRILFDSPNQDDEELYTREVLSAFLERAFRRSVRDEDLTRYMSHWRALRPTCSSFEESVQEVLVAVLTSPSFLFLVEPTDSVVDDGSLSEELLAVRLAYFLWNSPPDEELMNLARGGSLRANLSDQVTRLLDDPRSERFVRAFATEWLRLDRLEGMTINPNAFPAFSRFVKRDMAEETVRFLAHVLAEDMSLFTLVDSDFAMLNQNLAEFYGVEGVEGIEFRPVPVDPADGRGGLLAHGAFLAGHSDGNEPHPIKRAVWVKEKLLGQPPLPPPPNVPDLDPTKPGVENLTLKEQLELHRDNPSCYDCHAGLDPYGVALEEYNAVGLVQAERKGKPVDASVTLPDGTTVVGGDGLRAYLQGPARDAFAGSVIEHLFAYALGRDTGFADEAELLEILEKVRSEEYSIRAVIHAIASSPSFLNG